MENHSYLAVLVVIFIVFVVIVCWFRLPNKRRLEEELARCGLDPSWLDSTYTPQPDSVVRVESLDSVKPESWIPPPYLAEPPSYSEAMEIAAEPTIPQPHPLGVPHTEPSDIANDYDDTLIRTALPAGVFITGPQYGALTDSVSCTRTAPPRDSEYHELFRPVFALGYSPGFVI